MTRFKVGDRVRYTGRIGSYRGDANFVAAEWTVVDHHKPGGTYGGIVGVKSPSYGRGDRWPVYADDIELAEPLSAEEYESWFV